jgi:hypothetical protein
VHHSEQAARIAKVVVRGRRASAQSAQGAGFPWRNRESCVLNTVDSFESRLIEGPRPGLEPVPRNRAMKSQNNYPLRRIKLAHTLIWAVLAIGIAALPWISWKRKFVLAAGVSLAVLGEGLVLALNRGRCPLTKVAARYTDDRSDNFDIYLPLWMARNNKLIFACLFLVGEAIFLVQLLQK